MGVPTFNLDSVSTGPFQSGFPVFTLTCDSSGGPATTVLWKIGDTVLSDDSDHDMTKTLVDQSVPTYRSTLTVRGRRPGTYKCNVTNSKGESMTSLLVKGSS